MSTIFIAGIDTDTGKSVATGMLAKYLKDRGENVITQKLSQTGCLQTSEDIEKHREIMGVEMLAVDKNKTTCPYIFKFPASPHLSAKMEGIIINPEVISKATEKLEKMFSTVLLEGVGGLHVPMNDDMSVLDYLEQKKYEVILVSSAKLGSINHTLMSLEILKNRNIPLKGIIYNLFIESTDEIIRDSKNVFKDYLKRYGFPEVVVDMPFVENYSDMNLEQFSVFFDK